MQLLVSLTPAIVLLSLYALFLKISAFFLGRAKVRWGPSFAFSFLLLLISVGVKFASIALANSVPASVISAFGLFLGVAFGGWFFRARATDANGLVPGWAGALKLSALTLTLFNNCWARNYFHYANHPACGPSLTIHSSGRAARVAKFRR